MRLLTLIVLALTIGSCQIRPTREAIADEQRRRETANSAATIYEAAAAIEQGAPPAAPAAMIKRNASAIATAQGLPYPPAVVPESTNPVTPE